VTFKLRYVHYLANTMYNGTGFSRVLGNRSNGLPNLFIGNNAVLNNPAIGAPDIYDVYATNFSAGSTIFTNVNGHDVVLPADLTPYNYANNIGGLRDYFRNTVDGWLTTANFGTGGKNLLASDFQYPTTDTLNLGGTFKMGDHHSLDLQFIWSKTKHSTVQYNADGATDVHTGADIPQAWSYGPGGVNMGDNIFLSNQTASSKQLQVKYTYTSQKLGVLFNIVAKDFRSTYGGSVGSFDNGGLTDFYGTNAGVPWAPTYERRSAGSEFLSGSFAVNYTFDIGTKMGLLGTWHSGKFYDTYTGFNGEAGAGNENNAYPIDWAGVREGDWALDLGLRISHSFKIGKSMAIEPFLQVANLLNNYDYAANYDGNINDPNSTDHNREFGKRGFGWQANQPRTAAFGFRFTF